MVIRDLLGALQEVGTLTQAVEDANGVPGYRLKASAVRWVGGDGTKGADDPLRRRLESEAVARVNPFFRDLYRDVAVGLAGLHAKEHTAQVPPGPAGDPGARLPRRHSAVALLLADDGARRRHRQPQRRRAAQRPSDSGQLRPTVWACRPVRSAGARGHLLRDRQRPRRLLVPAQPGHGRRVGPGAASRPRQRGARPLPRARHLAVGDRPVDEGPTHRLGRRRRRQPDPRFPARGLASPDRGPSQARGDAAGRPGARQSSAVRGGRTGIWCRGGTTAGSPTSSLVPPKTSTGRSTDGETCTAPPSPNTPNRVGSPSPPTPPVEHGRQPPTGSARHETVSSSCVTRTPRSARPTSTPTATSPPKGSCPATPSPACRSPPTSRAGAPGGRPARATTCSGRGSLPSASSDQAHSSTTRVPATRSFGSSCPDRSMGRRAIETEDARRCQDCGYHHPVAVGTDTCEGCGARLGAKTYGLLRLQTVHTRRRERISSDEEERRRSGFELEVSYRYATHGDRPGRIDAITARDGNRAARTDLRRRCHHPPRQRRPPPPQGRRSTGVLARHHRRAVAIRQASHRRNRRRRRSHGSRRRPDPRQGHPVRRGHPQHRRTPPRRPPRGDHGNQPPLRPRTRRRGLVPARGLRARLRPTCPTPPTAAGSCSRNQPRVAPACSAGSSSSPTQSPTVARIALERCHFDPDTGDDLDHAPRRERTVRTGLLRLPPVLRQPTRPRPASTATRSAISSSTSLRSDHGRRRGGPHPSRGPRPARGARRLVSGARASSTGSTAEATAFPTGPRSPSPSPGPTRPRLRPPVGTGCRLRRRARPRPRRAGRPRRRCRGAPHRPRLVRGSRRPRRRLVGGRPPSSRPCSARSDSPVTAPRSASPRARSSTPAAGNGSCFPRASPTCSSFALLAGATTTPPRCSPAWKTVTAGHVPTAHGRRPWATLPAPGSCAPLCASGSGPPPGRSARSPISPSSPAPTSTSRCCSRCARRPSDSSSPTTSASARPSRPGSSPPSCSPRATPHGWQCCAAPPSPSSGSGSCATSSPSTPNSSCRPRRPDSPAACMLNESLFNRYPYVVVSTDFIKSPARRHEFVNHCPELVIVDEAHGAVADGAGGGARARTQRYDLLQGRCRRHHPPPHPGHGHAPLRQGGRLPQPPRPSRPGPCHRRPRRCEGPRAPRPPFRPAAAGRHPPLPRRGHRLPLRSRIPGSAVRPVARLRRLLRPRPRLRPRTGRRHDESTGPTAPPAGPLVVRARPAAHPRLFAEGCRGHTAHPCLCAAEATSIEEADALGRASVLDTADDEALEAADATPGADAVGARSGWHARGDIAAAGTAVMNQRRRLLDPGPRGRGAGRPEAGPQAGQAHRRAQGPPGRRLRPDRVLPVHRHRRVRRRAPHRAASDATSASRRSRAGSRRSCGRPASPNCTAIPGRHVLVATDCLSEGVNLQDHFQAVVHYDLAWNPTRHEQREGRVDRFGQTRDIVRAVTIYGRDNRIDGIVLDVLLRKHQAIRAATGVSVPVPDESDGVVEALMEGLVLRGQDRGDQLTLDLGLERRRDELHRSWESAAERERRSKTKYAQEAIHPDEVAREVDRGPRRARHPRARSSQFTVDALRAPRRLRSPHRRPAGMPSPRPCRSGFETHSRLGTASRCRSTPTSPYPVATPSSPAPTLHVEAIARHVLDTALDPTIGGRVAARAGRRPHPRRSASGPRCCWSGSGSTSIFPPAPASASSSPRTPASSPSPAHPTGPSGSTPPPSTRLLAATPDANVAPDQAADLTERVVGALARARPALDAEADRLAAELLDAHRRVRAGAGAARRGLAVTAQKPADILGLYIWLPRSAA